MDVLTILAEEVWYGFIRFWGWVLGTAAHCAVAFGFAAYGVAYAFWSNPVRTIVRAVALLILPSIAAFAVAGFVFLLLGVIIPAPLVLLGAAAVPFGSVWRESYTSLYSVITYGPSLD